MIRFTVRRLSCSGFFLALFGLLLTARGQGESLFTGGVWSGNVTPTSATVGVRLNAPGHRVRLVVSVAERLSPAVFSGIATTASALGNAVLLNIDGLEPATDYFYGIEVDGTLRTESASRGRFRTFPRGAASFRLAFASCGDLRLPDQRAYSAIAAEQPLLFLMVGDLHYFDTNSPNAQDYRRNYDQVLGHPVQSTLYRSVATTYMWDDHDFGGDNSDGTAVGGPTARNVYRESVPHYPITVAGGTIGQAFTVGRVRVIMTDLRSAASPSSMAESATKSRMGEPQKAWFKQELLSAREAGFPLILWVSTSPWIAPAQVGVDTWGGYAFERTEIANFLRDNRIQNLVVLGGDMHALAYDDGSNSDYATGGDAPLVVLQAAPLARPGDAKEGRYTAGPVLGSGQYGILEITDTGGSTVQGLFTGKRVNEGAKLVFQFTAGTGGVTPTGVSGPTLPNRALVNLSTRGRLAGRGDTLIVGFVVGGSAPRNILLRAVGPSLLTFGVADPIMRPAIAVYRGSTLVASNSDWSTEDTGRLSTSFDRVGAFRLAGVSSGDAAVILSLAPGPYTMQATSIDGQSGTVLVEAYEVP